jgi:cell division protease FtsH
MIHDRTLKILTDNKEGFLALAAVLLEKEVIFAEDLENIFGPRVGAKKEETPEVQEISEVKDETPEEAN